MRVRVDAMLRASEPVGYDQPGRDVAERPSATAADPGTWLVLTGAHGVLGWASGAP
ncbi:hypothetical protein [Streptomyces bluensis]|uniref:hypothetical protein n=1 Tax=Streptomyces bluensis TaxID=33897 RepID=UPI003323670D